MPSTKILWKVFCCCCLGGLDSNEWKHCGLLWFKILLHRILIFVLFAQWVGIAFCIETTTHFNLGDSIEQTTVHIVHCTTHIVHNIDYFRVCSDFHWSFFQNSWKLSVSSSSSNPSIKWRWYEKTHVTRATLIYVIKSIIYILIKWDDELNNNVCA